MELKDKVTKKSDIIRENNHFVCFDIGGIFAGNYQPLLILCWRPF
ncbi:MAG: hypothetical protein PHV53_08315 [Fermentimonas sp.]|nr:hypothetical protein [Fermentimonas sp.]